MSQSITHARPMAFFDFDGTLTQGDTLMPFLRFIVGTPAYYAKLSWLGPVLAAYHIGLLRNDIAKQIVLKRYLAGYSTAELFTQGQRFSAEVIPTMLRPEGMERLKWHLAQDHECVLVSASLDVYLTPWAQQAGFSQVVCTSLAQDANGRVTGYIAGRNCYGEEKARRIAPLIKSAAPPATYAYGDTRGDLPMLQLVDTGLMRCSGGKPRFSSDTNTAHWQRVPNAKS
tara:strand:+ start:7112 stop:7795 length:684 start_codon:yes stop_codon:yes gene_type:complete